MDNLNEKIVEWNRKRNNLEFDPKLEAKMLSEEASEFWAASDVAHMMQEYTDFRFVMIGTRAKYFSQQFNSMEALTSTHCRWQEFEYWMNDCLALMRKRLNQKLKDVGIFPPSKIFVKALSYVVEANEAKGTEKNADGKVVKGDNYRNPLQRIEEEIAFIQTYGEGNTYA